MICPECKSRDLAPTASLMDAGFSVAGDTEVELYRGTGCANCEHTGYKGRAGIFELNDRFRVLSEGRRHAKPRPSGCRARRRVGRWLQRAHGIDVEDKLTG